MPELKMRRARPAVTSSAEPSTHGPTDRLVGSAVVFEGSAVSDGGILARGRNVDTACRKL